jgi:hypothetical protein
MANSKPDVPQIDKFRKLAGELECDEDEEAFKARVGKVLKAPQSKEPKG